MLSAISAAALSACAGGTPRTSASPAAAETRSVPGFSAPESVLYDAHADQYFVSNINGDPFAADHNGFISRVSPDGAVIALRFIDGAAERDGLSAPKGMALVGRELYVADIDRVRIYDADSGAALGVVQIADASLLNDLDAAPDGTVYATDTGVRREGKELVSTGKDAIYALKKGRGPQRIADGDLGHPNGIAWNDGKLEVVTLGSGEWLTVGLSGEVERRTKLPQGMLDGLVRLGAGDFLASSWDASAVYRLSAGAPAKVVFSSKSPADIAYDFRRGRLLVPVMLEDRLVIAPLPR